MAPVRVESDLTVSPGEAGNICNQEAECRLVIMANRCESDVRRKECKVQRTVDGEITIIIKIEWQITKSWG